MSTTNPFYVRAEDIRAIGMMQDGSCTLVTVKDLGQVPVAGAPDDVLRAVKAKGLPDSFVTLEVLTQMPEPPQNADEDAAIKRAQERFE